jgi:nucleotide-binding universal stress UspA family protein
MRMTIVVPLDGSALAELALPYALTLARAAQGRLILLHAAPESAVRRRPDVEVQIAADLDGLAELLNKDGIVVSTQLSHEAPAQAITQTAREQRADLIVMGTHGRGGIGRALYGSVADQVLRSSPVPVFLVSPSGERWWPEKRPLRILVPLDGSSAAEEALDLADTLGRLVPVRLVLLRVAETAYSFTSAGFPIRVDPSAAEQDEARKYLRRAASRELATTWPVEVRVEKGEPSTTIAKVGWDLPADLIVMSTHGRGGLARLTLGSVATGVLQRARSPLLLVRPSVLFPDMLDQ